MTLEIVMKIHLRITHRADFTQELASISFGMADHESFNFSASEVFQAADRKWTLWAFVASCWL